MTENEARREIHRLYLRWMKHANTVQALNVGAMLESMTRELRYRRTIQPGSAIVAEIVAERQFVKATLKAYPTIGRELARMSPDGWEMLP